MAKSNTKNKPSPTSEEPKKRGTKAGESGRARQSASFKKWKENPSEKNLLGLIQAFNAAIRSCSNRYATPNEDLYNEAVLVLIKAANTYNGPYHEWPFYANTCIYRHLGTKACEDTVVREPMATVAARRKIARWVDSYRMLHNEDPTPREVQAEFPKLTINLIEYAMTRIYTVRTNPQIDGDDQHGYEDILVGGWGGLFT